MSAPRAAQASVQPCRAGNLRALRRGTEENAGRSERDAARLRAVALRPVRRRHEERRLPPPVRRQAGAVAVDRRDHAAVDRHVARIRPATRFRSARDPQRSPFRRRRPCRQDRRRPLRPAQRWSLGPDRRLRGRRAHRPQAEGRAPRRRLACAGRAAEPQRRSGRTEGGARDRARRLRLDRIHRSCRLRRRRGVPAIFRPGGRVACTVPLLRRHRHAPGKHDRGRRASGADRSRNDPAGDRAGAERRVSRRRPSRPPRRSSTTR